MRIYDGADATSFPGVWENALFFADYSRDCIWVMRAGADGRPDPSTVQTFDAGAANPVWLEVGPDGALYYTDFDGGRVMRIQSTAANQSPVRGDLRRSDRRVGAAGGRFRRHRLLGPRP